jgi:DNA-binding transcriptional ArsR family regulator
VTTHPAPGDGNTDQAAREPRTASNLEVLKALADPVRMNLMHALEGRSGTALPTMSVKELAAELGEPQTKLYRHVKHLESAGLIHAAATRIVSGIVEQRYQATHAEMIIGDNFTDDERASPEAEAMTAAALEMYRRQHFAARRARLRDPSAAAPQGYQKSLLAMTDGWVPAARAEAIRAQLRELLDEVTSHVGDRDSAAGGGAAGSGTAVAGADDGMVRVHLLIGYFGVEPPAG